MGENMNDHTASILGAQNAVLSNYIAQSAATNAYQLPTQGNIPTQFSKLDKDRYRFVVRKVINGFVLEFDDEEFICFSVQEIQDQVAVCMVERNLTK